MAIYGGHIIKIIFHLLKSRCRNFPTLAQALGSPMRTFYIYINIKANKRLHKVNLHMYHNSVTAHHTLIIRAIITSQSQYVMWIINNRFQITIIIDISSQFIYLSIYLSIYLCQIQQIMFSFERSWCGPYSPKNVNIWIWIFCEFYENKECVVWNLIHAEFVSISVPNDVL
jgi:hypothetical protein